MGCDSTIVINLTITDIIETNLSATICEGESYDFFGTNLTQAGSYEHTESNTGCDNLYLLNLQVAEKPVIPTEPQGKSSFCINPTNRLYVTNSSNASYYEWLLTPEEAGIIKGEIDTNNINEYAVRVYWTDDYTGDAGLSVKAFNECGESEFSESLDIFISPLPVADFSFDVNGYEVSFTNLSSDADSYQWQFGDDSFNSSLKDPVYVYDSSGTYNVVLTANNDICDSDDKIIQSVTVELSTNIIDFKNEISIYPNPTTGSITISNLSEFTKSDELLVTINTIEGRTVFSNNFLFENNNEIIDVSFLTDGMYIMKLQKDQDVAFIRFVKY